LRLVLTGCDITKALFRQLAVSACVFLIIPFCLTLMHLLARPLSSLSYLYIAHQIP
jgi:hypothetical protein